MWQPLTPFDRPFWVWGDATVSSAWGSMMSKAMCALGLPWPRLFGGARPRAVGHGHWQSSAACWPLEEGDGRPHASVPSFRSAGPPSPMAKRASPSPNA